MNTTQHHSYITQAWNDLCRLRADYSLADKVAVLGWLMQRQTAYADGDPSIMSTILKGA